jgi:hypothetical protein
MFYHIHSAQHILLSECVCMAHILICRAQNVNQLSWLPSLQESRCLLASHPLVMELVRPVANCSICLHLVLTEQEVSPIPLQWIWTNFRTRTNRKLETVVSREENDSYLSLPLPGEMSSTTTMSGFFTKSLFNNNIKVLLLCWR